MIKLERYRANYYSGSQGWFNWNETERIYVKVSCSMIHVTVADTDTSYGFYVVPEDGNISYQASYDNLVSGN